MIALWLLGVCFAFLAATLEGWALSVLWGWFMVPAFHLPPLRIPYAIGLALIVGALTHKTTKPEDSPDTTYVIISGCVMPFFWIAFGWIVKLFV